MKAGTLIVALLVACALLGSANAQTLNPPNLIDYQQKSTQNLVIQFSENIQAAGNPLFVIVNCSANNGEFNGSNCAVTPVIKTSSGQVFPFRLAYHTSADSGNLGEDAWYVISPISGAVDVNVGATFSNTIQLDAAEEQIEGLL